MTSAAGPDVYVLAGRELAARHRGEGEASRPASVGTRRRRLAASLRAIHRRIEASAAPRSTTGAHWILDNGHVVQEALAQLADDLPEAFYRQLPLTKPAGAAGSEPRAYEIAARALEIMPGEVDLGSLARLLEGYQEEAPLGMGELWALPSLLRLRVLEGLAQAGGELLTERAAPEASLRAARAILSLRLLAAADWRSFFDGVSVVERALRDDPAGVYAGMDFATRDRYRRAVEELGERNGGREIAVCREALALCREATAGPREQHVGFFLIDRGWARLARRVGHRPRGARRRLALWVSRHPGIAYFGGIVFATISLIAIADLATGVAGRAAVAAVCLLPAATLAVSLVNWAVTHTIAPRPLPKLAFDRGIPEEHRTLVVFPALLGRESDVESLLRGLEVNWIANTDPQLRFALLLDWIDAPREEMAGDRELLDLACAGIDRLERRHGRDGERPFLLLHRRRLWNPAQGCFMGWERKRGKLEELNRLLGGATDTGFTTIVGDREWLDGVRFVITLDADTRLPHGAASRLVATLAHPLNRAELAPEGDRVASGYAVLQPRIEISPASADRSAISRALAGGIGLDLYNRVVSDVYQDLFDEGLYAGKGIYEPRVFERCLAGKVPENALLSHDLFEGLHARAGLVSDVTVLEEQPAHVVGHLDRLHRWVRGDWQLLPWLLPRVPLRGGRRAATRLSALDRFKLFDNLRRSLVAPALVLFLVSGWTWLPGDPWSWTALAVGTLAVSLPLEALGVTWRLVRGGPWRYVLAESAASLRLAFTRMAIELALLPAYAAVVADAVGRTLFRLLVSRRHLLQWTTAAQAARRLGESPPPPVVWRRMAAAPIGAAATTVLLLAWYRSSLAVAAPFLLVWVLSPEIARRASAPRRTARVRLPPARVRRLRLLARRTWHFFERFVGPEDHWLPPDNYQEDPGEQVARRTSPTNVGLYLLSTVGAWDLGYIQTPELVERLRSTLEALEGMERHRGHFWNWVSTESLAPLEPRYVSTVDSGNLAACLLVLARSAREIAQAPLVRPQVALGLADTAGVLRQTVREAAAARDDPSRAATLLRRLDDLERELRTQPRETARAWAERVEELTRDQLPPIEEGIAALVDPDGAHRLDPETLSRLRAWVERLRHGLLAEARTLASLLPWLAFLAQPPSVVLADPEGALAARYRELEAVLPGVPTLAGLPEACRQALAQTAALLDALEASPATGASASEPRRWCSRLAAALEQTSAEAERMVAELRQIARDADALVSAMDFRFLYDPRRKLLRVGYNASSGHLDPNHYDLLASEARLSSFVAIAKGDVPPEHWIHLGRPFARMAGTRALLSWNGTAFEYLMAELLLPSPEGTPLAVSCRAATRRQISFARGHGLPWGISESGFHGLDAHHWYQYRAFGVPGTGLRRGLGERLVIAPYASVLALPYEPEAVGHNLERLEAAGMLGRYGLYEAADYGGPPALERPRIVKSYMSHHQGMILAALDNFLAGGALARRFRSDPRTSGAEPLLWEERRFVPLTHTWVSEEHETAPGRARLPTWDLPVGDRWPQAQLLSNGSYSVVLTRDGGGGSRWKGVELNPWHPDPTLEEQGVWLYVEDLASEARWSVGREPAGLGGDDYQVHVSPHQVEIRRARHGIRTHLTVCVAPHDDVEIRRLRVVNVSDRQRRLRITSFAEVGLASPDEVARHPAFARLFVAGELAAPGVLLFWRRAREPGQKPVYLACAMAREPATGWEMDRERFLGRGRTARQPLGLERENVEQGSSPARAGLDPAAVLRRTLTLAPGSRRDFALVFAAGPSRDAVLGALRRYRTAGSWRLAFEEAQEHASAALEAAGLAPEHAPLAQRLLSAVLFPHPALRGAEDVRQANRLGQPALWAHGLSGDHPIVLVRLDAEADRALIARLLEIHALWRGQGMTVDLVLQDDDAEGYGWPSRDWIDPELARTGAIDWLHRAGGIHLLRARELPADRRLLLEAVASVLLDARAGDLAAQLALLERERARLPEFVPVPSAPLAAEPSEPTAPLPPPPAHDGFGGFSADGREYVLRLGAGERTPAPWINVVSNPSFGFQISESGAGSTWAGDSGENRLTPWRNDPVGDQPGESLYLRDEETAEVWSPTPAPADAGAPYEVAHARGATRFRHRSHGLAQTLELFAPLDAPVKIVTLTLENLWSRSRRITATYAVEWVLGARRSRTAQHLVSEYAPEHHALLVRNPFQASSAERTAFVAADRRLHGFTADRNEFFGQGGSRSRPEALGRIGLTDSAAAGGDPCGVLQVHLDLPAHATIEARFLLGQAENRAAALALIARFGDADAAREARARVERFWDELANGLEVETPDRELDLMANGPLLHQALSCRLWARGALYQAGGAWGFRDQLQDVTAFLVALPRLAREHIVRAASRQFEAGDVLHWWHPGTTRGVRTRSSDDLLWLPWAVAEYLEVTGDRSLLDEAAPWLTGPTLVPGQVDRYDLYAVSGESASVYEHCLRALERGTTRGAHGLPLIGSCDWNDALSRVGVEGRGESVWLGWFLCTVLRRFATVCDERGEASRAAAMRRAADGYRDAIEEHGWDGAWYLRAFFDDGSALGAAGDAECEIDLVAQSWAALSAEAPPERARAAMEAAYGRLLSRDPGVISLLAPPFRGDGRRDAGYIQGYPPGVRENGGQYNHAAIWAAWAFAALGDGERAVEIERLVNPLCRAHDRDSALRYRLEPYAVAGDIAAFPPHQGRGGWSWYTGSAAWLYRLIVEAILGLRRRGARLELDPCIPASWPVFRATLRHGAAAYRLRVENPERVRRGIRELRLDGQPVGGRGILLVDDARAHEVIAILGGEPVAPDGVAPAHVAGRDESPSPPR